MQRAAVVQALMHLTGRGEDFIEVWLDRKIAERGTMIVNVLARLGPSGQLVSWAWAMDAWLNNISLFGKRPPFPGEMPL